MHDRVIPASPNWYCSRCSDTSPRGVLGFGARNTVYLLDAQSCAVLGSLSGHKERVSGFSFCRQAGQEHLCASSSDDGTVKFWDSDEKVLLKEHSGHQGGIAALHWSPADRNLVVSGDERGAVVCYWFNTGDSSSFLPLPRALCSLCCSPHTWSLLALGYKQGVILLVDVSKKGEVLHRLRGHEDEVHSLSWSPSSTPQVLDPGGEEDPTGGGGAYLASGSRDQTIRVWSSASGRGVMTLKLPYLKKRGGGASAGGGVSGAKDRLWLTVHWPEDRPFELMSSCFSGELVLWDLTASGKQKWSVLGSGDQNHSRIVFNMSSVSLAGGRQLLLTTSMDREIKCWDLASLECVWTLPTLGGGVYALSFSPVATGLLALGGADQMIRSWDTLSLQNPYRIKTFWQGIRSKITALAWHPSREGWLAFGTDDGKVGIYDAFSSKPPQISSSYHQKTIYRLAWAPPLPPLSSGGAGEREACSLYSCGGEGVILQHDPRNLASAAGDIDSLIRDTNAITHKLSPHTDFSWKPDGTVVAIGNEDGSVDVYAAPRLKQLCSVQQHAKMVNTLQWYPALAPQPDLSFLLASGSSSAKVLVHDLRSACETPSDPPAVISEAFRTLGGHTGKITGLSWSPHHPARLVTVSYDRTAQVWDVLKGEGLVNYRGHGNRVMCVEWSPVDPDVVWTGADDFTTQEWRPSRQEFSAPPKGKKTGALREKSRVKTNNMAAATRRPEGEPAPVNGERGSPVEGTTTVNGERGWRERETLSVNGERETRTMKGERGWRERDTRNVDGERDDNDQPDRTGSTQSAAGGAVMKPPPVLRTKEKPEVIKRKKARSMLPLSTAMDHRSKEDLLEDCITLATITHSPALPAGCIPGHGEHLHLGLFSDRPALRSMFLEEEEAHLAAGHPEAAVYLRLWSGDVEGALRAAAERGELSDHLLALAPTGGYVVWHRAVQDYVKQLCLQDQHLKAASFLLSINMLQEAIELLRSHKMYREAIALARARLPDQDPVLKDLYLSWAVTLERDGHLSAAAKCYVAAGAGFDAAKVVSKKSDAPSLRAAATLARLAGERQLADTLALRCAKSLATSLDWVGAQEVLKAQDSLLVHRLCFCAAEILSASLMDVEVVSGHPWARPSGPPPPCSPGASGPEPIQDRLRAVWQEELGVDGGPGVTALLEELHSVEKVQLSTNSPPNQVVSRVSVSLSLALLLWLQGDGGGDDDELMKVLWEVVEAPRGSGLVSMSAQLCLLLFPEGDVSVFSRRFGKFLVPVATGAVAACASLQAFVNYHFLYDLWWSHAPSGTSTHQGPLDEAAEMTKSGEVVNKGSALSARAAALLSEPHAAHQAALQDVARVQERLAALVLQHAQVLQPDPGQDQDQDQHPGRGHDPGQDQNPGQMPEEQDSLLSLSAQMTSHQRDLALLPDALKMFPHPEVVECSLLVLHMVRCRALPDSESLQNAARDLLRRYASSTEDQRAARRFLT